VDRGNQTEVLAKEMHFHHYLDQKKLRWRKETRKELFVPTTGVMQLVDALRKVQGLQLLLFDANDWREDSVYSGGIPPPLTLKTTETMQRGSAIAQKNFEQTVLVRLSTQGIHQLRSANMQTYNRLMNLMRASFNEGKTVSEVKQEEETPVYTANATVIDLLSKGDARTVKALEKLKDVVQVTEQVPTQKQIRRSPRFLQGGEEALTVGLTKTQLDRLKKGDKNVAKAVQQLQQVRRSPRLAAT